MEKTCQPEAKEIFVVKTAIKVRKYRLPRLMCLAVRTQFSEMPEGHLIESDWMA